MEKPNLRKPMSAGLPAALLLAVQLTFPSGSITASGRQEVRSAPGDWGAFSNGVLHLLLSSHQDIAWMDSPQACADWRDRNLVTPALELLEREKDFCFSMEDALMLLETLDRHPERIDDIVRYTKQGRLEWGATYTQPYESLLSGEQLVRQTYLGRRLLKKLLPGCDSHAAFNPDVPGRAMQMPQILRKAGIPYLLMSRHAEGLYRWVSPDGTGIFAFSPGHYYDHRVFMEGNVVRRMEKIRSHLETRAATFPARNIPNRYAILFDKDWEVPESQMEFVNRWNALARGDADAGTGSAPCIRYSTFETFMDSVIQTGAEFKTLTGERPNLWLYIHGPTHHWAITAQREAAALLPAAETFAAVDALIAGDFRRYPSLEFEQAWKDVLYPDHGWGGYNGDITDHVFRVRYESARDAGRRILDRSLMSIAGRIRTQPKGLPVTVFNTLSWDRTDPVTCILKSGSGPFCVKDGSRKSVPFQRIKDLSEEDPKAGNVRILFMAEDVPAMGYKTFYAVPGPDIAAFANAQVDTSAGTVENPFYRVSFAPGGVRSLFDKSLGCEVLQTDKFLGGELFTMQSAGNGAGEFNEVQQPSMEGFDKLGNHRPKWRCIESGPVRTVFEFELVLPYAVLREQVSVYHPVKRIDFDVSLLWWDGTKYREFRMAVPVGVSPGRVAYEVPMGVVERGKDEIAGSAGWHFTQPNSEVRPREVQNFITAFDDRLAVTLSSSVSVCDFADPTTDPVRYPVLQPVLLASRKSCHGFGNWYLQPGDHHFHFSLSSHAPDWRNGWRFGIQSNRPLEVVAGTPKSKRPDLPEAMGFCSVSEPNVVVSAFKKAEDGNSIVLRAYDIEGRDTKPAFQVFFPIKRAEWTNLIEEEGRPLPSRGRAVALPVGHHAIETIKLDPSDENGGIP